jgi:glycine oxidase
MGGMDVTLLERDRTGAGTSHVAAGMLAPVSELEHGDHGRRLLELGLRAARMWPAFAAELERASGREVGLLRTGSLLLARDDDEAAELERKLELRRSLGLEVERLRPSEARGREPALSPGLRLALGCPGDHSLDPRMLLAALRDACERAGVRIRERAPVARIERDGAGEALDGVTLEDGERIEAARVVIAAGPWSGAIAGLPGEPAPIHPVKGQILRLRDPDGPGLLRTVVRFEGGYVVPRGDGRYVLGATVEERGFAPRPTVGGIYELLRDAHELVPGISELDIEELSVGFRPRTPDNAPLIGPGSLRGLVWASGHHRNGILLTPLTAEMVLALLSGSPPADALPYALCDPSRFARERAHEHAERAPRGRAGDRAERLAPLTGARR